MWIATQDGLNRFDGYDFKVFKHNPLDSNSIPDNYVQSLFRDSKGLLWIGTYGGGLSSFDPVTETFRNYKHNPDDATSISDDQVMSICEDKSGDLWIGTSRGLNKLSRGTSKFKRHLFSTKIGSLSSDKIRVVHIDQFNDLWIGTADGGLNRYIINSNSFSVYQNDPRNLKSISSNNIQQITSNKKGELVIGTSGGGVNILDKERKYFRRLASKSQENIHHKDVWAVIEDKLGGTWAGTYGAGLLRYRRDSDSFESFKNDPADNSSLSNNVVLCSYLDRQGFIWLGTLGGGVSYFDPSGSKFVNIRNRPDEPNSLNENVVMSFHRDNTGMYIGTYGGGLNYRDPSGRFHFYKNSKDKSSIPSNIVRAIFRDSKGRIWVGTYDGGLSRFEGGKFKTHRHDPNDEASISSNDVWCIREDSEGMLWLGTWGGGLNKFNPETGKFKSFRHSDTDTNSLSNDKVISLHIDANGTIWAGTNGGGLNRFDRKTNSFTVYRSDPKDSSCISSDRIRCIISDKRGQLWIGTDGGGLNQMNVNGRFKHFNEHHGLPNNVIYGILEDDGNNLWLSTNNGLCRFNQVTGTARNFDITDGLQGNEFNQGAWFKSKDGTMYFGGIGGVSSFKPDLISSNKYLPPVILTSIKLFGHELQADSAVSVVKELKLDYDQNFVSFDFTALDLTAPEKNQYACKMEGFDKDWIFLGNKRFVSYTNLDPGEYVFRIIASNNENYWNNNGTSIKVIISPPFYKTSVFYLLMVLLLTGTVYTVIRLRTKNLKLAKKQLEQEVMLRTREVVHQKEIIEGKNKDITDSINYARRIQRAILPSTQNFKRSFEQSFIFYRPKDIVSGDFYWTERFGDDALLAVVDCTGHGVPGAFLSIVGNNLLNQAVNEHGISKPSLILNEMNKGLAKMIRNQGDQTIKDGMDMALCAWNSKTGVLQFSGANNPVWIIRAGENQIEEIRGDKMPVGSYGESENAFFTNHEVHLKPGDRFFLSSDGYSDQFGGPQGKKLKKKGLKDLLISTSTELPDNQQKLIRQYFEEWSQGYEQVDDVLLIGVMIERPEYS